MKDPLIHYPKTKVFLISGVFFISVCILVCFLVELKAPGSMATIAPNFFVLLNDTLINALADPIAIGVFFGFILALVATAIYKVYEIWAPVPIGKSQNEASHQGELKTPRKPSRDLKISSPYPFPADPTKAPSTPDPGIKPLNFFGPTPPPRGAPLPLPSPTGEAPLGPNTDPYSVVFENTQPTQVYVEGKWHSVSIYSENSPSTKPDENYYMRQNDVKEWEVWISNGPGEAGTWCSTQAWRQAVDNPSLPSPLATQ